MNRTERRAPVIVRAYARTVRCPDCNSETTLHQDASGVWRLTLHHDDTCPTFRAITRGTR